MDSRFGPKGVTDKRTYEKQIPDAPRKMCEIFMETSQIPIQWMGWNISLLEPYFLYEGVSKIFRTGSLGRELQMVQLSATSCSCEFCRHNPLCCFSTSVYCCKRTFRYRLSPETFGYTLVHTWTYRILRTFTDCEVSTSIPHNLHFNQRMRKQRGLSIMWVCKIR
jgi:hypothetical protein